MRKKRRGKSGPVILRGKGVNHESHVEKGGPMDASTTLCPSEKTKGLKGLKR